jgi:hypothetical protein
MLMPMLPLGWFAPVRSGLENIFTLQDGGHPPRGRLTSTAGAVGTTGPKWLCMTGGAISLAADYYRYSHDQAFLGDLNAERGDYGPVDVDETVQRLSELARHPTRHVVERIRPDGTAIEIRGAPMPDGGFVTIYTDVTARRNSVVRGAVSSITASPGPVPTTRTRSPHATRLCLPRGTQRRKAPSAASTR